MNKWIGVVIILLIVGLWLGYGRGKTTKIEKTNLQPSSAREIGELNMTKVEAVDKLANKKVEAKQLTGQVKTWNPDGGLLEIMIEGRDKTVVLKLDPKVAKVFTPSLATKGRELLINNLDDIHWQSAFCPWDIITAYVIGICNRQ